MRVLRTNLPLLDKGWHELVKEKQIAMPQDKEVYSEPPTCYGPEPYSGDGRVYLDYDPKKVITLNYTEGMYDAINARAKAELVGRVIDYRHNPARRLYTFKVIPYAR